MAVHYSCLQNPHGQTGLVGSSPRGGRIRHDWSDVAGTHTRVKRHVLLQTCKPSSQLHDLKTRLIQSLQCLLH